MDGEDLAACKGSLQANLDRLHQELRDGTYVPQPVLQQLIPKAGQPGKSRRLGIPTVHDRVCQQALLNRLEPTFDPMFEAASCGYRPERSTHDALRKIWGELQEGYEWVVDADLREFVGSAVGPTRPCPARTTDTADPHIVPGPLANIFLGGQAGAKRICAAGPTTARRQQPCGLPCFLPHRPPSTPPCRCPKPAWPAVCPKNPAACGPLNQPRSIPARDPWQETTLLPEQSDSLTPPLALAPPGKPHCSFNAPLGFPH